MNFRLWLEDVDLSFGWIDPDTLWDTRDVREYRVEGGFTFIYTEKDGLLVGDRQETHGDLKERVFGDKYYVDKGLPGRCGEMTVDGTRLQRLFVISFWGNFSELEGPCTQAVLKEIGDVKLPIVLSTKHGNQLLGGKFQQHVSKITPEDIELLRQLHVMNSPQKLVARKQLGLFNINKRPDAEYRVLQPENKII